MIRAILACDNDWGIGKDGDLPWPHNPADLKWFKEKTLGGVVVMGGKTWRSLPRKPLPNRENVVITRRDDIEADVVVDMDSAVKILPQMNFTNDVWIIGGAQIVKSLLPYIDEVWLSRISGTYNCDTFLPRSLIEELFTLTTSEKQNDVYVEVWEKR